MRLGSLFLAAFLAALPFAGRAQTTPTPAPEQASPTPPAAPAPAPAPASKVTFTPYGFILTNAFFSSGAFAADDYPQYAQAPGALNDRGILFSSRYNRIGVRIGGPEVLGAKAGAVLEADFGFGFVISANQNVNASVQAANFDWYKPIARMRLGFATLTWGDADTKVQLLMGQDYGLVNPLFAVTLGYIGTPLFQNAGNLYTRTPQVKLSGDFGKDNGVTVQLMVGEPMDQNITGNDLLNQETPTLSSGGRARIPELEARVAGRYKTPMASGEIGVSGAYHKERYLFGTFVPANPAGGTPAGAAPTAPAFTPNGSYKDLDSGIAGLDAVLKFPFVEVRGEGFIAHNGDMYFAHLGQGGVAPVLTGLTLTNVLNKRTKGFWAQGILTPIEWVQLTGGYGVELPLAADNLANGQRTRNSIASAGIIFAASKNLKFSAEGAYTYTATKGAVADTRFKGYQTVLSSQYTF
jgi:hypothetical protein